jgi:hypothetical protein
MKQKPLVEKLIKKLKALRIYVVTSRYYSEKEVEELLTKQRQLCADRMDRWCEYNNLKKCGHVVEYAACPLPPLK